MRCPVSPYELALQAKPARSPTDCVRCGRRHWVTKIFSGGTYTGFSKGRGRKEPKPPHNREQLCRRLCSIPLQQRRLVTPHLGKMGKKGKGTGSFGELELLMTFDGTVLGGTISDAPRAENCDVQVSATTRHTLSADAAAGDRSTSRRAHALHVDTQQQGFANVSCRPVFTPSSL